MKILIDIAYNSNSIQIHVWINGINEWPMDELKMNDQENGQLNG